MYTPVAVGIIINEARQILIAKRPSGKHLSGLWEFPGGKIEPFEDTMTALKRELFEELNIEVLNATSLFEIKHHYKNKAVCLKIYKVDEFIGEAIAKEGQQIAWVNACDLRNFQFPEANQEIIKYIHNINRL